MSSGNLQILISSFVAPKHQAKMFHQDIKFYLGLKCSLPAFSSQKILLLYSIIL